MKTTAAAAAFCLLALLAFAAGPALITIKGSKKTADSHRSTSAGKARQVTHTSRDLFYEFELTTSSPAAPANVVVKWVVVTEDFKGRQHVGTKGEKETPLPRNRPTTVETGDFNLESRDVRSVKRHVMRNDGAEEKIVGYGVRVYDGNGKMIAEEYNPNKEEQTLVAAFDGKLKGRDDE